MIWSLCDRPLLFPIYLILIFSYIYIYLVRLYWTFQPIYSVYTGHVRQEKNPHDLKPMSQHTCTNHFAEATVVDHSFTFRISTAILFHQFRIICWAQYNFKQLIQATIKLRLYIKCKEINLVYWLSVCVCVGELNDALCFYAFMAMMMMMIIIWYFFVQGRIVCCRL